METNNGLLPYAIIGRGAAAVVNLATLPDAMRDRRIIVIGGVDPWTLTRDHDMGQWPRYLTLPGFEFSLPASASEKWQRSRAFASVTALEFERLSKLYKNLEVEPPGVVHDVSRTADGNFAIRMDSPSPRTLIASHVDICTGPGQPKWPESISGDWAREFLEWKSRPSLVVAGDYYQRDGCPLPNHPDSWVAVYGSGGTAAWCAERAIEAGKRVLWIARTDFSSALTPSGRNDDLLKKDSTSYVPLPDRLWLAIGQLTGIDLQDSGNSLKLICTTKECVNSEGKRQPFPASFHQVVVAVGQIDPKSLLSPELRNHLKVFRKATDAHPAIPDFDLGRATSDRRLRLLGAAGIPAANTLVDPSAYEKYERTIHPQAHGVPNFPIATLRIAWANGRAATSHELATRDELALLVPDERKRRDILDRRKGRLSAATGG